MRKADMIEILSPSELARAKETGKLVADILQALKSRSTVGTNLLDIDRWAKTMILEAGAQSCYVEYEPSFGRGPLDSCVPRSWGMRRRLSGSSG